MKMSTLNKLPEDSLNSIHCTFRFVYIHKDIDRDEAFQFVAGIIAGLNHAGILTNNERRELFQYYKKWFSL